MAAARKRRRIVGELRVCGTAVKDFACPLMLPGSGPIDAADVVKLLVAAHGRLDPVSAQFGAKSFRDPHRPALVARVDELRLPTEDERDAFGMPATAPGPPSTVDVVRAAASQ